MKETILGPDILKAVSRFDSPVFKTPITRRVIYPKVASCKAGSMIKPSSSCL